MSLTAVQADHIARVFTNTRAEMTRFLESGADVVIYKQTECGSDVPPYAVAVAGTDFWIDCCETVAEAIALTNSLGLKLLEVRR